MAKFYTCCKCRKKLSHDMVIYADTKGRLTLSGKPFCNQCLPGNNEVDYEDDSLTVEEKIDELTKRKPQQ